MSVLRAIDVSKSFGAVGVLKGVNLDASNGDFIVLVGPSGCGKSTLLAIIAGLEQQSSGDIVIGDRIVNEVHPKDRNIAMVFQNYALYPTMTVRDNLTFGLEARRVPKVEHAPAVARVAKFLQIEPLLDRKPSQLSGGQRQRVAMGRALVRNPDLFLFDEPLSNLDAKLRAEMRVEIKRLHQSVGITTIYVTHDQVEAMTLATKIAVMNEGRIQQYADPQTVYELPANIFVATFMGTQPMNLVPATVRKANGKVSVALPNADGTTGVLPVPAGALLDANDGDLVTFGFRAEHVSLADLCAEQDRFLGEVLVTEPLGPETIVMLDIGGSPASVRVPPDQAPPIGAAVNFAIDMRKTSFFDRQSGLRIE
jgi:multiple sugar transport system ATP-binding protein